MNPIISIIYDNNPYKERLESGWGIFCIIEGFKKTILFYIGGES